MTRRRKPPSRSRPKANQPSGDPPPNRDNNDSDSLPSGPEHQDRSQTPRPGLRLKVALSLWLLFHFFALAISYTGVVEPSETQSRIMEALQFYVGPTQFSADGRPVYLARGVATEQPHRLQTSEVPPQSDPELFGLPIDDRKWKTILPPGPAGLGGNDRYGRWLSTAATLATNEQPSLVAELLLPTVMGDPSIQAVRIVRLPTELTTMADDASPPPYAAYVARKNDSVSFVQVLEPRLSTQQRGDDDE